MKKALIAITLFMYTAPITFSNLEDVFADIPELAGITQELWSVEPVTHKEIEPRESDIDLSTLLGIDLSDYLK